MDGETGDSCVELWTGGREYISGGLRGPSYGPSFYVHPFSKLWTRGGREVDDYYIYKHITIIQY